MAEWFILGVPSTLRARFSPSKNNPAALKLMRKLLKKYAFGLQRPLTDDWRSYGAAVFDLGIERGATEFDQRTRRRERKIQQYKNPGLTFRGPTRSRLGPNEPRASRYSISLGAGPGPFKTSTKGPPPIAGARSCVPGPKHQPDSVLSSIFDLRLTVVLRVRGWASGRRHSWNLQPTTGVFFRFAASNKSVPLGVCLPSDGSSKKPQSLENVGASTAPPEGART
jgi:hypothetical protein